MPVVCCRKSWEHYWPLCWIESRDAFADENLSPGTSDQVGMSANMRAKKGRSPFLFSCDMFLESDQKRAKERRVFHRTFTMLMWLLCKASRTFFKRRFLVRNDRLYLLCRHDRLIRSCQMSILLTISPFLDFAIWIIIFWIPITFKKK